MSKQFSPTAFVDYKAGKRKITRRGIHQAGVAAFVGIHDIQGSPSLAGILVKKENRNIEQRERFVEAARKLGADESEPRFDEALKRVGKAKLSHPPRAKDKHEKARKE